MLQIFFTMLELIMALQKISPPPKIGAFEYHALSPRVRV
jgi:hypothetical protein